MSTVFAIFILLFFSTMARSQTDSLSTYVEPVRIDTSVMAMDENYHRPFLFTDKFPVSVGGYAEANTQYAGTDGISEGFSFQFRRLTLFFSSTISRNVKFLTELEFEDGTKEINLEYAALDLMFDQKFNLRGGIITNPIGMFNQNHDGPKWEFIERPIEATELIGATLSNVGMGFFGKVSLTNSLLLGYEVYLTNGFDDKVISNELNRTSLAEGKLNADKFEESNSGLPMFTGKLALHYPSVGELGISYLTGVYNKWKEDGIIIDNKRAASIFAIDLRVQVTKTTEIVGEAAFISVELPPGYTQQFGEKQFGFFADIVQTIYTGSVLSFPNAKVNIGLRGEYVDFNQATFIETGGNIGDDILAIVPAVSLRLSGQTVIRLNYRYEIAHDLLDNPATNTAAIQAGFSTYF